MSVYFSGASLLFSFANVSIVSAWVLFCDFFVILFYDFANRPKIYPFIGYIVNCFNTIAILRFLMKTIFPLFFLSLPIFSNSAANYTWAIRRCFKGNSRWRDDRCYGQEYDSDMLSKRMHNAHLSKYHCITFHFISVYFIFKTYLILDFVNSFYIFIVSIVVIIYGLSFWFHFSV